MPLSNDDPLAAATAHRPIDERSPPEMGTAPPAYAPGTGRRLKFLVGGLALLLLGGFLLVHLLHFLHDRQLAAEAVRRAALPPPVDLVTAIHQDSGRPLLLPGEAAAWFESTIYARVSGYVGSWSADIGDRVKRGQVLASIDTPELDAALHAAQAKLAAAQAGVQLREAEAGFADTTYARWRDSPAGVVSEQEREDKKAQFASAKAKLAAAHADLAVDQAEVDRLDAFEKFKQVTAPYAGTVTERRIDIGNLVTAGSAGQTTLLYRMAQTDPIRVFVDVPQSAAADLMKLGVPAEIIVGDLAGRRFPATVSRTSAAIDPKSRTFRAEIDLPNPDLALVPGMYVQASFQLANSGTVQVPAAALVFQSGGPHVARVDSDQKVHFVAVTIARDDGSVVEIGDGLSVGDKVILNVSNQIVEGDPVAVQALDGKPVAPPAPVSAR